MRSAFEPVARRSSEFSEEARRALTSLIEIGFFTPTFARFVTGSFFRDAAALLLEEVFTGDFAAPDFALVDFTDTDFTAVRVATDDFVFPAFGTAFRFGLSLAFFGLIFFVSLAATKVWVRENYCIGRRALKSLPITTAASTKALLSVICDI